MKKKKRRSISLSARAAIALILLSLSTLSGWRDVAIYFGAKSGNTETVTAECIAVQSSRTDELRQHTPYRMLYVLTLQDETKVAVSSDEAKSPFSSLEDSRQHFVIGKPITCTYVRRPAFSNGEFALLSVTCGEEELYPESAGIAPFKDRTGICLMFDFILWGAALPLLIVPPLRAAIRKRKSRLKRNSESRHEERSCVPGMDNRPFAAAGAGFLQYKFGGLGHQICHCKAPKGTR